MFQLIPIYGRSTTGETVKFWCKSSFSTSDGSREARVYGVYNYDKNDKFMSSIENNVKSTTLKGLFFYKIYVTKVPTNKTVNNK